MQQWVTGGKRVVRNGLGRSGRVIPALTALGLMALALVACQTLDFRGDTPSSEPQRSLYLTPVAPRELPASAPAPEVRPLTGAPLQALLARLPPLPAMASAESMLHLPPQSPPPPRTGATLEQPFPPPQAEPVPTASLPAQPLLQLPAQQQPDPDTPAPVRPPAPPAASFEVVRHGCDYQQALCRPGSALVVAFSQPLAADQALARLVRITPAIADLNLMSHGRYLHIQGELRADTTYQLRLDARLKDDQQRALGRTQPLDFAVGFSQPQLFLGGWRDSLVLDPHGPRELPAYGLNLERVEVILHRVTPADWPAYQRYRRAHRRDAHSAEAMPGELIARYALAAPTEREHLHSLAIDLSAGLSAEGLGHLVVQVRGIPGVSMEDDVAGHRLDHTVWVQSTQLALSASVEAGALSVWSTALQDGTPLPGVQLALGERRAESDREGQARLPLADLANNDRYILVAQRGQDTSFLPQLEAQLHYYSQLGAASAGRYRLFAFDDRGLYRPGEQARIQGLLRRQSPGAQGDLQLPPQGVQVTWQAWDSRRNPVGEGQLPVSPQGSFELTLDLAENLNLGELAVTFEVAGETFYHALTLAEFRRPDYAVNTQLEPGPHLVGAATRAQVVASYYSGEALPDAPVRWQVTSAIGYYQPPGWDSYQFGPRRPWWPSPRHPGQDAEFATETLAGVTDGQGQQTLELNVLPAHPAYPRQLAVQAEVTDLNHQAWQAQASTLVHPGQVYVGLRTEQRFLQRGEPLKLALVAAYIDGTQALGYPLEVSAARVRWESVQGRWQERTDPPQRCRLTATEAPGECQFATEQGGEYRILARVRDAQGRYSDTELSLWVGGGERPPARQLTLEELLILPDQEGYQPGDQARIRIQSPFPEGQLLISVWRQGALWHRQQVALQAGEALLALPVTDAAVPGWHLTLEAVGSAERTDDQGRPQSQLPPRPAHAWGEAYIAVEPRERRLAVAVSVAKGEGTAGLDGRAQTKEAADPRLLPGSQAAIQVVVTDHRGEPVADGEVTLYAVDEAVLALAGYTLPDPLAAFYGDESWHHDHYRPQFRTRELLHLMDPSTLAKAGGVEEVVAFSADMALPEVAALMRTRGHGDAPSPLALRSHFAPLAFYRARLPLDTQGRAQVDITLPDTLTRYRVMAVAHRGERDFGAGETPLTVSLPLALRPSPPRFLNLGDRAHIPVVVHNQTEQTQTTQVVARGNNLRFLDGQGRELTLAAGERGQVHFAVEPLAAGPAHLQAAVLTEQWQDAVLLELPVLTPISTEAYATYGSLIGGVLAQPVQLPEAVHPDFGGLELTTSSTQLQALTDAYIYLVNYPFDCAEQSASRLMSILALQPVLAAFESEGLPAADTLAATLAQDLERLQALQNDDGGWGLWRRGERSWPYASVHATHALVRAAAAGQPVATVQLDRALDYLQTLATVSATGTLPGFPEPEASEAVRASLRAYALSVQHLAGRPVADQAKALLAQSSAVLQAEALGWLLSILADDHSAVSERAMLHRMLIGRAQETAATAEFVDDYGVQGYRLLHASRRANAVVLTALLRDQPHHPLVEKLVRGLLAHRHRGHWGSTQENIFVLQALERYFQHYEQDTPDLWARAWLGEQQIGSYRFEGRGVERQHTRVPMDYLAGVAPEAGAIPLVLAHEGQGRVYYRIGLRYAPAATDLAPVNYGFAVAREYLPVDDPEDVQTLSDGSVKVRAGARVRIRLTMTLPASRYHVALLDPLPAGFEPPPPASPAPGLPQPLLLRGAALQPPPGRPPLGWGHWYEHQQLRDSRAEAFTSLLGPGVYHYEYEVRATTAGDFIALPARAEEMYHPETFGRSGSVRVRVE